MTPRRSATTCGRQGRRSTRDSAAADWIGCCVDNKGRLKFVVMARKFDYIAAGLGLWLLGGIYTDGWAHNHIHVETFFTPWHAVLYSGFLANLIFYAVTATRNRRNGKPLIPEGYRLAVIGIAIFAVSGVGDL